MSRSCGLDIATCTGIALVGEGEDRGKTIHFPDQRGFARLQSVAAEFERIILTWRPDVIVVESYAHSRNLSSFVRVVEVGTIIRSVLHRHKMPWYEVGPSALKKWVTGKGNASKEEMAQAVQKRWAYTSKMHDIVDAYALAQLGQLKEADLLAVPGVFREGGAFSS